jgi:thiamine pyrophosphate-dependent acetolactate synthase large subunit-like protein
MKVGDRLANLLIEYGIEYVFGVPGRQTLQFYHGIMKSSGKIKHFQQQRFKTGYISADFHHIDFATVAKGFGVRGYTARTAEELSEALKNEQSNEGPAVIDVITDQWETPVLRSSSIG